MSKSKEQPPACIQGGKPPCPTCTQVAQCQWGSRHVNMDKQTAQGKEHHVEAKD
jgi:hypothetical protein